jgi:hypothetical protein
MVAMLRAVILPYKTIYVPLIKLNQDFEYGSSKEKKECPIFENEHGMKALFYVEERFQKVADRTLKWNTRIKRFNGFEEVLIDTDLLNWEDLVTALANVDKMVASFEKTLQEMYHKHIGMEARNTQIEYYKTLRMPMKGSSLDHAS